MNRRHFISSLGGSALSIALLSSFKFSEISAEFEIREVRDGVFIYTNRGGTIMFTATEEGWMVVDTQFPAQSEELIGEMKKMNRTHIHFASGLPNADGVISGMRKTSTVHIYVDPVKCADDDIAFFTSDNGVIPSPNLSFTFHQRLVFQPSSPLSQPIV